MSTDLVTIGTTGTRRRICPYDIVVVTTPMYEKKHWDGDLADLTGQCVKVGHEMVLFTYLETDRGKMRVNWMLIEANQEKLLKSSLPC